MERLQKILSQAGIASRRASEQLMLDGRVSVNGATVRELGSKAEPGRDDIRVDGRRVTIAAQHRYILLNKPRGYVTTRSDPERRPTVIDLLEGVREYVYPVGRLDFDTEGLLLLTNDGDLAARLTHPRHGVARVYEARVLGVPDAHDLARLGKGIRLEGRRTQPALVKTLHTGADEAILQITVHEGRNRQVRNMCEAIGHPASTLRRVAIGPIRDTTLRLGRWRELNQSEVARLKGVAATATPPETPPRQAREQQESRATRPERSATNGRSTAKRSTTRSESTSRRSTTKGTRVAKKKHRAQ